MHESPLRHHHVRSLHQGLLAIELPEVQLRGEGHRLISQNGGSTQTAMAPLPTTVHRSGAGQHVEPPHFG